MEFSPLHMAVAEIPTGRWVVGVSGGADSVALLRLLNDRADLSLHVAHLNHETRNGESSVDAHFVESLARTLKVPITVWLRSEIESELADHPKNISARFRMARIAFFKRVVAAQDCSGVILAHHADDQAETIFQRLIRGAGPVTLAGMSSRAMVNGVQILRPFLATRSSAIRAYLRSINQEWREDSSNRSLQYVRNKLRVILAANPELHDSLIELGGGCAGLRKWMDGSTAGLAEQFAVDQLASLPAPLARRVAARWLAARGSPAGKITLTVCDQLVEMASDFATPPRQHFPGGLLVRRKKGVISLDSPRW